MNLYLIGYRGCGKSTVAGLLAARLELPHKSTDEGVEFVMNMPIACKTGADPDTGQNLLDTLTVGGWEFEFESDVGFVSQIYPIDVQENSNLITIDEPGGTCPP